jgi:hypothetical protein
MQAEALDDIVQRLAVAKYALEAHDEQAAQAAIDGALAVARKLITDERETSMVRDRPAAC